MSLGVRRRRCGPAIRPTLSCSTQTDSWVVDTATFASKGRNTPVQGQQLKGGVMMTMYRGQIVFRRGNFGAGTGVLQQASKLEGILGNE